MRIWILPLSVVCAVALSAQSKFSWQDYCFQNPRAPVCKGNDYAVKPPAAAKGAAPRTVVTSPSSSTRQTVTPSLIVVGAIDWRFADPFADALVGLNFSGISASPLARSLITLLGAKQGLSEAEIQKIFDGLSDVDQVALSVRNNRMVAMITGHVADTTLPAPEAGLKAVPISAGAILIGHTEAVDQAIQRIGMKSTPTELTRSAEQRQASSEFWTIGSAGLPGPQGVTAGVKRFSLTVWIRDRLTSDVAFEFNGVPSASTLRTWRTKLGSTAIVEGNAIHVRAAMEAGEVQQKVGEVVAGPMGQGLAALVEAARYLPVRDSAAPKQTQPIIYGLDPPR